MMRRFLAPNIALSIPGVLLISTISAAPAIAGEDAVAILTHATTGERIGRARLDGSDLLDGQRIYQRQNVGEAYVHGFEFEVERVLAGALTAYGWGAYAYGQQTTAGQPMRRIPPFNGAAGVRWTGARLWGALQLRAAARQDRLAQGDRDDHRMNPNGTPGWMTAGVNVAYRLGAGVRVVGGAENLFDRAYRVHGSGVDGYGRYVWAGLHVGVAGGRGR